MSFLKKLTGDAIWYGMPSIVGRMLNYLMVSVHTRAFVDPAMLADNGLFYTFVIPLNIVYTFGMETAFFRYGSKKENQSEYFNIILSYILVLGSALSLFFVFFATPIANAAGMPGTQHLVKLFAGILLVDSACAIAFVKLRTNNRVKKFSIIRMTNILINIGFTLLFIVYFQGIVNDVYSPGLKPVVSRFYSVEKGPDFIIFANYIASVVTLLLLWREFVGYRFVWVWNKLKVVVKYAWPLMLMGLAGAINLTADRLLFNRFLPPGFYPDYPDVKTAFGIYTNVYKLSIFMTLIIQAYRYAAEPLFFAKMEDKNSPKLIALSTKWFTIVCIFIWLAVSVNLNWISLLIGETYRYGLFIVPILLLANLFIGLYNNISIWFKLSDQTQYGTYITVGAMVVTVVLNILLIPVFGFLGSALSFAISSFLMVGSCYYFGEKYYPIPYETRRVLFYMVVAGLMIWGYSFFDNTAILKSLWIQGLLCIGFVFLVYKVETRGRTLREALQP